MSINGNLDAMYIDRGTAAMMRESGRSVSEGWWGIDDNFVPRIGPFDSEEACQAAIDNG